MTWFEKRTKLTHRRKCDDIDGRSGHENWSSNRRQISQCETSIQRSRHIGGVTCLKLTQISGLGANGTQQIKTRLISTVAKPTYSSQFFDQKKFGKKKILLRKKELIKENCRQKLFWSKIFQSKIFLVLKGNLWLKNVCSM